MKTFVIGELILFLVSVGTAMAGAVLNYHLFAAGVVLWMVSTTLMLHRIVAYIKVVDNSAKSMDNMNRIIDSLLVSPAQKASRQARDNAPR